MGNGEQVQGMGKYKMGTKPNLNPSPISNFNFQFSVLFPFFIFPFCAHSLLPIILLSNINHSFMNDGKFSADEIRVELVIIQDSLYSILPTSRATHIIKCSSISPLGVYFTYPLSSFC